MISINTKRESVQKWDRTFGPGILNIIEKEKVEARYSKANYAGY